LRGNPLNEEAFTKYLPLIELHNPGVELYVPEPGTTGLLALGLVMLMRRRSG